MLRRHVLSHWNLRTIKIGENHAQLFLVLMLEEFRRKGYTFCRGNASDNGRPGVPTKGTLQDPCELAVTERDMNSGLHNEQSKLRQLVLDGIGLSNNTAGFTSF
jgi:hypothetical protein